MTLLRLLLIFPAYFLGIYCAVWWDSHRRVYYHYSKAVNDVRQAYLQLIAVEERFGLGAIPTSVVNQWLDNSLPANHPAWRVLVERMSPDPWRNPYRSVRGLSLNDGTVIAIGVYSMGRDGQTRTQGNDPDDINSWVEQPGSYYRAEINTENRKRYTIQGLFVTPLTYAALLAVGFFIKRICGNRGTRPRRADTPRSPF